jgi:hypothetical protein
MMRAVRFSEGEVYYRVEGGNSYVEKTDVRLDLRRAFRWWAPLKVSFDRVALIPRARTAPAENPPVVIRDVS